MTIDVELSLRRGAFALDVAFAAGAGLTALFGRSGSGKTTVIHLIAGLAQPDRGRITVDGTVLLDTARHIRAPVHLRRIGCVFQEARLLPHLSVRHNLGFGRWFARRQGVETSAPEVDNVVEMLGIGPLLERHPAGLSGGERQRVAIGRALLSKPRLLLMDEPLSALDASRKNEILPYIERMRDEAGIPIVYVSHSVEEVSRLASTVVVLEAGRVSASGPADDVLRRPDLIPHATEAGAILSMTVAAHDEVTGLTRLSGPAGQLTVPRLGAAPGSAVRLRVPARDVLIATAWPHGLSARNVFPGRITTMREAGASVMVEIDCNGAILAARVTRASARDLDLTPGHAVFAIVKSVAFDPQGVGIGQGEPVEV
ncbi:molybdenum ABC transporter ATP-binding protein [Methylobacterium gnaphalii]|uniref:Molybdenum import ATP-binding protein ModC n=1 Tax=Methylobacterium gnaphalii TaxID=1010610 RepID=A0A512JLA5_9HYPH|nr:molybdenum ABC transporter ATP-binding protein [Methylobacterium gnaphalii]GEP10682.1 molybdenum import ATP-binding protein ModC [Methylobacterium gnaphalii]GJD67446.1 Sulfate/thiosulfate import ATP-binding protein CysA [Methylobacterium gnaphalii]GLS47274.1 molybdenum import ATP-binding protein ModC [Methylobacterium gnaphalii]